MFIHPPVSRTSSVNRTDKCLKQMNVLEGSGMRWPIIFIPLLDVLLTAY